MTLITKAKSAKTCGQCCLAMLADVPLSEAIQAVGHRRGTTCQALLDAARRLGLRPKTKLWQRPDNQEVWPTFEGKTAVLRIRRKGRRHWHWVAVIDGVFHDPDKSVPGQISQADPLLVSWMEFEL